MWERQWVCGTACMDAAWAAPGMGTDWPRVVPILRRTTSLSAGAGAAVVAWSGEGRWGGGGRAEEERQPRTREWASGMRPLKMVLQKHNATKSQRNGPRGGLRRVEGGCGG